MITKELLEEVKRLELDLVVHEKYRKEATLDDYENNEYLIKQTMKRLSELKKILWYEK